MAVQSQVKTAMTEADIVLFLVDILNGVTPFDREIANMVRRAGKPAILVVNKADNLALEIHASEFYELALGEPYVISAHHGRGTADLLDKVVSLLPPPLSSDTALPALKIAIVGRPNVGKSMLLNGLIGKERVIVSELPGTTRDAIDTNIDFRGQSVILIDTAGIRRRGRQDRGVERYSVMRAMQAIDRADIALLILDATEPFTDQDKHIAGYIQQAQKGAMLVINKWDLVTEPDRRNWEQATRSEFQFLPYAPILFISAKFKQGIEKILPLTLQINEERNRRLPTAVVNSVVQEAIASHPPPTVLGKTIKIKYCTQVDINPPTFVFFVNDTRVHFSYKRYLENKLREAFGFTGTALRIMFKTGGKS